MAGNMNLLDGVFGLVDSNTNFDYVCTRGYRLVDVTSTQNATAGGAATVAVTKVASGGGSTSLGSLTVTTTNQIVYATTLDNTALTFASGDTLRFTGDRADMSATVSAYVIPTSWISG